MDYLFFLQSKFKSYLNSCLNPAVMLDTALYHKCNLKIFLLNFIWCFHSLKGIFYRATVFNFDTIHLFFFFSRKLTACPGYVVDNECQICDQQGNFCTSWWKDVGSCPGQEEDKEKDSFLGNWRSRRIFNLHLPVR